MWDFVSVSENKKTTNILFYLSSPILCYSFSYFHFSLLYPHLACYTFSLSVFLWAHLCLIILLPAVYLVRSFSLWQFIKLSASCHFVCPMCFFIFIFIFYFIFNFSLILISLFTHWIFSLYPSLVFILFSLQWLLLSHFSTSPIKIIFCFTPASILGSAFQLNPYTW